MGENTIKTKKRDKEFREYVRAEFNKFEEVVEECDGKVQHLKMMENDDGS